MHTILLPTDKQAFYKLSRRERADLYDQATQRIKSLPIDERALHDVEDEKINADLYFVRDFKAFNKLIQEDMDQRTTLIDKAQRGEGIHLEGYSDTLSNNMKAGTNMENLEVRSLQKYITSGYKHMDEQEQRALNVSGSGVVIPTSVMERLITDEKYSTLLNQATVFNEPRAGKISIPIASNTSASWKIENSDVNGSAATYEASPSLTNLELGGFELYRWARISAAAHSLSTEGFEQMLLQVLGAEVVETLEEAFVKGSGSAQPKGLDNLTYVLNTNLVEATTAIGAADIAKAVGLLPAKYARNSIVMMNTSTLADVALLKGTTEFAYDLSTGAQSFLGHPIVVNEHVADDVIYIVDPKELYVRFSMPMALEANTASGFTKASVDLRALTVVDAAWNPKAVVKVAIAA